MAKRWGLVIDQERCIGCEACTVACAIENKPAAGRWIRVETVGAAHKDTPTGLYPDLKMEFQPRLCMHCDDPPCVDACTTEALVKREDGPVVIENDLCNGCRECIDVCPYEAILYDPDRGEIEKCHFCAHRIDRGIEPFCVMCCEGQAMFFGDLDDPKSPPSLRLAHRTGFQLLPEAGTRPSISYCAPLPKRGLRHEDAPKEGSKQEKG